jgi:hypothetical protein
VAILTSVDTIKYRMDERGGFASAYPQPHGLEMPRFKDNRKIYPDPNTPRLQDPFDDEPPSLQKGHMAFEQEQVPDPDDPSVVMTPASQLSVGGPNAAFFGHNGSFSRRGPQQPPSMLLDANLPEDEQQSVDLIDPLSGEDQGEPEYDPFSNHLRPPPGEFGPEEPLPFYQDQLRSKNMTGNTMAGPERYVQITHGDDYGGEEKKIGIDEHVAIPFDHQKSNENGEDDFVPIKRDGYQLGSSSVCSPSGVESVGSHKSAAFRSAQELLRKNRRRRQDE